MNVRAGIGIYDGYHVKMITVDRDGNPAFTGSILYGKYQKARKVKKLLKLGDIYDLRENIEPVESIGHYLLKDDTGKVVEIRLQEGVVVSKNRDIREIDENNIVKKNSEILPREYPNPRVAFIAEGLEYLYIFDAEREEWETWGIDDKTNKFQEFHINYITYIRNLVYRDELSSLSPAEKAKLDYVRK